MNSSYQSSPKERFQNNSSFAFPTENQHNWLSNCNLLFWHPSSVEKVALPNWIWRLVAVPSALHKSHSRNQVQEAAQNEHSSPGYTDSKNAHSKSNLPQALGLILGGGSCNSHHEIHTAVTVIINKQVKFVYLHNLEKCPIQCDSSAQPGNTNTCSSS